MHAVLQEEAMKEKLPEAIRRREHKKNAASLGERIVMAAEEHKRAQELLKEEVGCSYLSFKYANQMLRLQKRQLTTEIMEQMKRKQMRAQWKKSIHARKRY